MYRQGELLFVKGKVKGEKLNHLVIAEGEATGHKHEVVTEDAELYEKDGVMYLRAKDDVEVVHPDHKTLPLPKGDYEIIVQREYVVGNEKYRRVAD